jgi:hypothetical protein
MNIRVNPLDWPLANMIPRRLTSIFSWHEHMPFAFALVQALKPSAIVELGTHRGDSYCAFCQAVEALALPCRTFAVDTWQGDEHSRRYDTDEILSDLQAHHDPLYGRFSTLLRMTFDEALARFEGGSIDLLHIDGLHTYEAVRHDFETWLPKVSRRGVVLLHDTAVRDEGFGVWRLWAELKERYPHLEFTHGFGLGVLQVGAEVPQSVRAMFAASDADKARLADCFAALGRGVTAERLRREAVVEAEEARAQFGACQEQVIGLGHERDTLAAELADIRASLGFRLLDRWQRMKYGLLPPDSRRRAAYSDLVARLKRLF